MEHIHLGILLSLQGQLLFICPGLLIATSSRQPSLVFLSSPRIGPFLVVGRLDLRDIRTPKEGVILGSVHPCETMPPITKGRNSWTLDI